MTEAKSILELAADSPALNIRSLPKPPSTIFRILRYIIIRGISIFLMVVVVVWLSIIVLNFGGHADEYVRSAIITRVLAGLMGDAEYVGMLPPDRMAYVEELAQPSLEAAGLNQPFLVRSVLWLGDALTLGWGQGSEIRSVIFEALPKTLLVFTSANALLFVVSITVALRLMRKPDSWFNKLVTFLSPLSIVPAWMVGLVLFAVILRLHLFDLLIHLSPPEPGFQKALDISKIWPALQLLILPVTAIFLSKFFQSAYAWRNFFMLYEQEPYIELARAKGLKPAVIERKYILRAALPAVITNFAMLMVALWQEVIILETVFNVQGIGWLFASAVRSLLEDAQPLASPVMIVCVTVFAYLLAITVFMLDIVYAFVDPRIAVGGMGDSARHVRRAASKRQPIWQRVRSAIPTPQPINFSGMIEGLRLGFQSLAPYAHEIRRSPLAVLAMSFIAFLIVVSIATVILLPYDQTIARWRGDDFAWANNPPNADPEWINLFLEHDLPPSIHRDSRAGDAIKEFEVLSDTQKKFVLTFPVDYPYGAPPQEFTIRFFSAYDQRVPFVSMMWITPDGREFDLGTLTIPRGDFRYDVSRETGLLSELRTDNTVRTLFADPASPDQVSMPGQYHLRISAIFFDAEAPELEAQLAFQGHVFGLAGTDVQNRDLMLPLLWGTPVALVFGLVGAFGTTFAMVTLAAISTWFGGWVDSLIQRLTEINMILPVFPFAIMIFVLYSKSIFVILAVTVLLSIFGSSIKTYRAMFLQLMQAPYIESARAYGTSSWRIIFVYLIPRIAILLIPQIMILIPSYVFLEAALATLKVSDPYLPTWGKLIADSFEAMVVGNYHKSFAAILLIVTAYAFAILGFTIERRVRHDMQII